MKTFQIQGGDLVIGPGGYATVSGPKKVLQDLSILVREPYGIDRFHPQWGGILEEFVGQEVNPVSRALVRGEIERLLQNYMVMQSRQIAADMSREHQDSAGVRPAQHQDCRQDGLR
jgi:phage baseplate assembly protein W